MKRGDIVRAQLPRPQGAPGREQFGTRPAIVIQSDSAIISTVIIVPLTSQMKGMNYHGSFLVNPDPHNGLTTSSVVLTHQIRAIDKSRIGSVIGVLSSSDLTRLESELRGLLGL